MGMSSSQARLLNLTARMHQIEYKAAKLEAQKLQMANDSKRVYDDYLNALDASKMQYKSLNTDGSITYKDATLNSLENGIVTTFNGECLSTPLFLQSMDGHILLTPTVAAAFGIDANAVGADMDTYVHDVTGKNKIISNVSTVQTRKDSEYVLGYNYSPVANTVSDDNSGNNSSVMIKFTDFVNNVTSQDTSSITDINNFNSSVKTYAINDLAGLQKLQTLCASGTDTSNYNFILGNDIDMSSITNWTGINNFKGTFDGNGHTISGLTGTAGLFISTDGANIKDLKLKINNISNTSQYVGGLVGTASSSPQTIINNCVVDIDEMTIGNWSGGMVGNGSVNVSDSCVNFNKITSNGGCVGGLLGHGATQIDINNCYISGTMNNSQSSTGGIFGHNYQQAVATITNSTVYVKLNSGGSVMGDVDNINNYTISNVTYNKNLNPTLQVCHNDTRFETTNNSQFLQMIITPSIAPDNNYNGSFYSNVYGALHKYTNGNTAQIDETKIRKYVENIYKSSDNALKVANINDFLYEYLKNDNFNQAFFTALAADIQAGTVTNTTALAFQNKYNVTNANVYLANIASDTWTPEEYIKQKGKYNIPSIDTMKEEVYYLLKQDSEQTGNPEISQATINSWFNKYSINNTDDKISLANLNNIIANKNVSELRTIIASGNKYTNTNNYPKEYYDIVFDSYSSVNVATVWDTTQEDISNAIKSWHMSNKSFEVISEDLASNKDYLINYVNGAFGVLAEFDPNNISKLMTLSANQWLQLSEAEFNKLLSVEHTSISTNTSIQEVNNEVLLKKAEAKYEADMKRIDMKDRKYDTDLAALDAERNAIKQEMETLKTVAKDNVERTFKLFS